ncbi:MAG: hypothetical protein AUI50_00915 [Crenarchaeota archaeon 13_1_40CM_2_52_14]|nr:MAG: hypothetical protein AUI97_08470 [Crenarchaeota archaeon 13_1_40CM_3_52_17]OLD35701.1 MAG: hypothetical protein AUI50_00915 [Crenarchaeota archaeon 13_1_40CM_2_52_14]OLE68809.1 MAG: hypothetical protein AUF78_14230 [archaeon 13_1_20CM_2_51_12]
MGSLSSAKTLGGVGGILVFLPGISLVGWILILLATKEISESVQDKTIFDDALLAGITAIIGAVVFGIFVFSGAIGGLFLVGPFGFGGVGFLGFLAILGAFWVFSIISAIFLKRSYEKISQRLNVSAFATAGLLYLIGAALTIIFVGFLILLIALVFQVVAYFSIQDRPASPGWGQPAPQSFAPVPEQRQPPVTQQQSPTESKFCFKCGAKLPGAAVFCTSCGAKQS